MAREYTLQRMIQAARWHLNQRLESFIRPAESALRTGRDPREEQPWTSAPPSELVTNPNALLPQGVEPISIPPDKEFRDIPLSVWVDWSIKSVRGALAGFALGQFGPPGILIDSMIGDDRIQSAFDGRAKGVTKCEVSLIPAQVDVGQEVVTALLDEWEEILPEETVEEILRWSVFNGFALVEVIWEPWPIKDKWIPRLKVWHPFFIYYRYDLRCYVAITQDGAINVDPDDPKWLLYTPHGSYRGWLLGRVRSCAIPWMVRQFALRDLARFSEVHGLPMRLGKYPAQAPTEDKARFIQGLKNLGAETTVGLPIQAGSDAASWGVELLEAKDTSWEAFMALRDACDLAITLAIRGTNLTSQVGQGNSGNRAAAETHQEEEDDYSMTDRRKLMRVLRRHLFKWYCIFNYGRTDAVPAPKSAFVHPQDEDTEKVLSNMRSAAQTVVELRGAGANVDANQVFAKAGVPMSENAEEKKEKKASIPIAPTDLVSVVRVDEVRSSVELPPWGDEDGNLSVAEFRVKTESKENSLPVVQGTEFGAPVPEGGSSCAKCTWFQSPDRCGNSEFQQFMQSKGAQDPSVIPADPNAYCCNAFATEKQDSGTPEKQDSGVSEKQDSGAPEAKRGLVIRAADWKEDQHPRSDDGKFGSGGGGKKDKSSKDLREEISEKKEAFKEDMAYETDPDEKERIKTEYEKELQDLEKTLEASEKKERVERHEKAKVRLEEAKKNLETTKKEYEETKTEREKVSTSFRNEASEVVAKEKAGNAEIKEIIPKLDESRKEILEKIGSTKDTYLKSGYEKIHENLEFERTELKNGLRVQDRELKKVDERLEKLNSSVDDLLKKGGDGQADKVSKNSEKLIPRNHELSDSVPNALTNLEVMYSGTNVDEWAKAYADYDLVRDRARKGEDVGASEYEAAVSKLDSLENKKEEAWNKYQESYESKHTGILDDSIPYELQNLVSKEKTLEKQLKRRERMAKVHEREVERTK